MSVKTNYRKYFQLFAGSFLCLLLLLSPTAAAYSITPITTPQPVTDSYGLEATKTQPPPTQAATITVPGNGASYSTSPITVSGVCPTGLLIEIYDNGAMVGAANCTNGSFSLQVSLFGGSNVLTASDFDDIGQAGPQSNSVTVNYNNANFSAFGDLITLTSQYGRMAANINTTLTWPVLLSGGTGPYAFSVDWGDGSKNTLQSQSLPGTVNISHVYTKAGIYTVTVQVTDHDGVSAFLQLVALANGANGTSTNISNTSKKTSSKSTTPPEILWAPTIVAIVLMLPIYWLGRKSELLALRKHLERDMEKYKGE